MPIRRVAAWFLSSSARKAQRLRRAERLIARSRYAEADRLLSSWIAREPNDVELRLRYAFSAHNAGRFVEALGRWAHIRMTWPDYAMGWSASASNLRELGRLDEAQSFIEQALVLFPTDLIALSEATRIFDRLGHIGRSLALGADLMRLDPGQLAWRKQQFERLMGLKRYDEAAALLGEASAADRDQSAFAFGRALIALRQEDVVGAEHALAIYAPAGEAGHDRIDAIRTVALERSLRFPEESRILWTHLARIVPGDASILHHRAEALIRCGRYDEAGEALTAAVALHADDFPLQFDHALLALKTERWEAAIERFGALLRRRPDHEDVRLYLARARMDRAQALLEAGGPLQLQTPPAAERQDVGLVEDDDIRRLVLGFESLGQDCEFGLVQRRYGAEPLGLFRWNFCDTDLLTQASEAAFEGMGDPQHTAMELWEDYEYYLADRRWGFAFHTWISRHEVDRDQLYKKMCRRIGFLRAKLLEDLAAGDKIVVHKTFAAGLGDVRGLLASLRAHGPVRLLWVRSIELTPDAGHRPGTVEEIEPGLYAGFVSTFGNAPGAWQIPFDQWVRIARAAAALGGAQGAINPKPAHDAPSR